MTTTTPRALLDSAISSPRKRRPAKENLSLLLALLSAEGLPTPETEIRFAPPRRWRIDAGYRAEMIAIEVEGAIHVQGRHTRGVGYENDMRKYNHLALLGWLLIRVSYGMIATGEATEYIKAAMLARTPAQPIASVEAHVTAKRPRPRRKGAA